MRRSPCWRTRWESKTMTTETIEVLRATHDGEDLSPPHLYLVQLAVNGNLSDEGKVTWAALVASVRAGTYKKPWHMGVEHLTKDHQGYIYWRDVNVEHYSFYDDDGCQRER